MAEADDLEPGRVAVRGLQQRLDRGPHGAPPGAELAADPVHAGVFTPQLSDRPPAHPHRQRRPRPRDGRVLLNEHPCRALRVRAHPTTLQPPDPHPPPRQHNIGSLIVEVLKIRRGRSPLIIEGLDTPTWDHAQRAELTPHSVAKSHFHLAKTGDLHLAIDSSGVLGPPIVWVVPVPYACTSLRRSQSMVVLGNGF